MKTGIGLGIVLAAVAAGGVFGDASASIVETSSERIGLTLTIEFQSGGSVVAHLLETGGEEVVLAMAEVSSGRYQTYAEIRRVDYVVVFEELGRGNQSNPLRLTQMGADPDVLAGHSETTPVTVPPQPGGGSGVWLLVVAGVTGVGSLVLFVLYILGVFGGPGDSENESGEDPGSD